MSGLTLRTARLVRRPGAVEIVGSSAAIAGQGIWRLFAGLVGGAICGLGFLFARAWWQQAIASLFGVAALVFFVRFLVATVFAPLMGQMSKVSVLMMGVPRIEVGLVSIPFHEIDRIDLDGAQNIHVRRRDGRVTMFPELLTKEPRQEVEALVSWLRQAVQCRDPRELAQLSTML